MKKYLLLLLAALTFVACSDEDELVERNFSETYWYTESGAERLMFTFLPGSKTTSYDKSMRQPAALSRQEFRYSWRKYSSNNSLEWGVVVIVRGFMEFNSSDGTKRKYRYTTQEREADEFTLRLYECYQDGHCAKQPIEFNLGSLSY